MLYKEIFKLKEKLEEANIPFVLKEHKDYRQGYQILYPEAGEKRVCSVIEHRFSYGHENDLLEIAGLVTGEEETYDSVVGFLTAENVFLRIKKHWEEKMTKADELKNEDYFSKENIFEVSDLNKEENQKYICGEAQPVAIYLQTDSFAPTYCLLERAYVFGRRVSEKRIAELEEQIEKMKRCKICNHFRGGSCSYHSLWVKDCKANGKKLFELRENEE